MINLKWVILIIIFGDNQKLYLWKCFNEKRYIYLEFNQLVHYFEYLKTCACTDKAVVHILNSISLQIQPSIVNNHWKSMRVSESCIQLAALFSKLIKLSLACILKPNLKFSVFNNQWKSWIFFYNFGLKFSFLFNFALK